MSTSNIEQKIKYFSESIPNKTAIEFGEEKVSYLQLEEITSKVANFLMDRYDDRKHVFIMMERGPSQIEALIGVMKSGGIFITVDCNVPDNRIIAMLQEVQSSWIITTSTLVNRLNKIIEAVGMKINVLLMDSNIGVDSCKFSNLNIFTMGSINAPEEKRHYEPNKHCYIYFTSGSTGKPKGVLGRHRSLMQFIEWEIKEFKVNSESKVSQLTSPSFDPFLRDIFVPLCAGGTLCIPYNQEFILDSIKLIDWIEKNNITLIHMVPSVFKLMANEINSSKIFSNLKYILLAGEVLRGNDIKKFIDIFGSKIQLVNLYGPTETTLAKLFYRIDENDRNKAIIPVGKPIDFTDVLILNDNLEVCATSVVGEIYIRTPFISSGYCNDRELTNKVFLKNPFTDNPKDIIYKTGDLGSKFSDGNIEVIGRADNQVKIRGMRIELGEIENVLLQHCSISEAVVMAKEDAETKYLCAYIVSNDKLEANELREFLLRYLPQNMVPTQFALVDKMPLTTSGKIDRKMLLDVWNYMDLETEYVAPKNKIEEKLVEIWESILNQHNIGVEDNFFELGGHSLKASKFIGGIYKEFNVEIPLSDFFKSPNIRKTAEYIEKAEKSLYASIEKAEERDYYPVSHAQRRMFIVNQLNPDSTSYNLPILLRVKGKIISNQFEKAVHDLILRHESLRTSFHLIDGEIVQKIDKEQRLNIKYSNGKGKNLDELIKQFVRPFNLQESPLLRVEIITLSEESHILMFDAHHIISDGTSIGILINEFAKLYEGNELEPLRIQYKDYSEWQNNFLKSEEIQKQKEYWINKFSGEIPVLNMPTDFQRPLMQSFEGDRISFNLDKKLTAGLNRISKETGSTLYMVMLSAINVLLSKYSGQEDIVIGSPIAGRPHADLQGIIGMFVNTLAMRNEPSGYKTYEEFLKEVRENALKAYENQDYQFEELVNKLDLTRDTSRNPLFDVMFVFQNMEVEDIVINEVNFMPYKIGHYVSKFDITINATEVGEEIAISIEYSTKLFKKETIERMSEHLENILNEIVKDRKVKLKDVEILGEEERNKLLYEFNDTYAEYQREKTIHELFEEQVEKAPDSVAVVFEDSKLTYRELNEKSNRLARTLRSKGVVPDSIVGIMVERSLEMIVGIMGILKAGGAYLPIDPNYPEDRVKYMLQDSNTNILLTQTNLTDKVNFDGEVIDLLDSKVYEESSENLEKINTSNDLAYVIYTSGSTGKPKGVMIRHFSVVNRLNWMQKQYKITEEDVILQKTTFTFDVSVWEMFWWSLQGAKVCLLKPHGEKDPETIINAIYSNKVTTIHFVPSMLNIFLEYLEVSGELDKIYSLKQIFASGEALKIHLVEIFNKVIGRAVSCRLINLYGPTEATVDVSYYNCFDNKDIETIPIGKPIDNIKLYVLSNVNRLQPIGIPGELCISGEGLARGYLNKPELTAEKFIENIFIKGERMYKTGDLARWLPDGNIEFLGRIDHQVKIRGFRIELGEIESNILTYEGIKKAVVIDREDEEGNKYLCAYVVSENEIAVGHIREHLSAKLPEYMVPSYFIQLDKISVTVNGKIDRKALPKPENIINTGVEYEAPRNELEEKLCGVWEEVLGVKNIGINDNFFEIGGDSFKALKVISRSGKKYSLMELYKSQTIKRLCERRNIVQTEILTRLTSNDVECNTSLVCIPYGGGTGLAYKQLADSLLKTSNKYSVYIVNLPGHDISNEYESLKDVYKTARICAEEIKRKIEGPISLYGHCIGYAIALEIAHILEKDGIEVDAVYIGAMLPPKMSSFKDKEILLDPWKNMSYERIKELITRIEGFEGQIEPDELNFIMKCLRHDVKSAKVFYYNHIKNKGFRIAAPLHCIVGEVDPATKNYKRNYRRWNDFSLNKTKLHIIKGSNHYFLKYNADELANIIVSQKRINKY